MEEVCGRENCLQALKRVKSNKGSAGADGMTVGELSSYLLEHWPTIREQLLSGSYKPQPVRRVEIPKPDGGVRKLGIPTVLDRMVQQAVMQVLQRRWDAEFSSHSHGFRPGRSAHQAVTEAQRYVASGRRWVVDLDLEKFFDRVNHDKLMAAVARRVADKRVLKLIRAFLTVGVMENGLVGPVDEGTPQGGPLSPLLSNLVLDELDRELERRKHCFVRYADDCNIYVRSRRAGERVAAAMAATYPYYAEKRLDQCMPLAYGFSVQTVVETPMFLRAAEDLYSEADREEIVRTIAAYPEAGDLMPGTGGYRKLRFARSGMGKRGGARIVYLYGGEDLPIFLITVYAKSE
jgi:retron-type reverse transcriptase